MSFILGKKVFCLVTGASRGLGASIACSFAKICGPSSTFVLIGRSKNDLQTTCNRVTKENTKLKAFPIVLDLATVDYNGVNNIFNNQQVNDKYDLAVLIHNAAHIGPIGKKAIELQNKKEIVDYFDLNFNSVVLLTSAFMQRFKNDNDTRRIIVNVSSGASYRGHKGMHLYSAGKAARDGFFRVFADEEPSVRVLNFNPGPLITDMQREVEREIWADEMKKWSKVLDGMEKGTFGTDEKSADILVDILNKNNYESGSFMFNYKLLRFEYSQSLL